METRIAKSPTSKAGSPWGSSNPQGLFAHPSERKPMTTFLNTQPPQVTPDHNILDLSVQNIENHMQMQWRSWADNPLKSSLALVHSGFFREQAIGARVVTGTHGSFDSDHTWIVFDAAVERPEDVDIFDPYTEILDLSLWSHMHGINLVQLADSSGDLLWIPAGYGDIEYFGVPESNSIVDAVELTPKRPFSHRASYFLTERVGLLDAKGWQQLAHAPLGGWPSREIITAMVQTPAVAPLIPTAIVSVATNLNPQGVSW